MAHEQNPTCIQELAELKASTKSAHKRLDNIDELMKLMHQMNTNVATIANETKNQGKQLESIVETMKGQGEKIDAIENQMETKETVKNLIDRIDVIEKKDGKKAEKLLTQIKWLLISLFVTGVFGLLFSLAFEGGK